MLNAGHARLAERPFSGIIDTTAPHNGDGGD